MKKTKVNNKFKLGLDWHGCVDKFPDIFKQLADIVINSGGEVHIITGHSNNKIFQKKLKKCGWNDMKITNIFSITDYLITKGFSYNIDKKGGKMFELQHWNSAKAFYCSENNISLMIDDSEDYARYFTTPYLLLKG